MAQPSSFSAALNRLTGGNNGYPKLVSFAYGGGAFGASGTNLSQSWWKYMAIPGAAPVPPTSATVCTRTTQGAIRFKDPESGQKRWLRSVRLYGTHITSLTFYDRLTHISGLSGTSTSTQTITLVPNRYTTSESIGNEIWVEVGTQIGATPTTITATYKDSGGTSRTSQSVTIGGTGNREANRAFRIPLDPSYPGVTEVTSVILAGSTGTAGNIYVMIARPLFACTSLYGRGTRMLITEDVEIKTDCCGAIISTGSQFFDTETRGSLFSYES